MLLEPQSTSDAIEALRRKYRLVKKRIKRTENYFVVEHVYQAQQVKPYIKSEIVEMHDTKDQEEKDSESEGDSDTKTLTPNSPIIKTVDFPDPEVTPTKTVRFDPNIQRQEFHTPVLTPTKKPKDTDTLAGFAKEVIKSTADVLFPPLKTEIYSPDSRPIRGHTKSYAEMFPDPVIKTEEDPPEDPALGPAYNTRSQQPPPGQPPGSQETS